jgi:chromosome segregation ATPase
MMDSENDGSSSASFLQPAKESWSERRRSLMESIAGKRDFSLGKSNIALEMDRISSEIKMLAESNQFMANSVKNLQANIALEMDRISSEIKMLEESNHFMANTIKDLQVRLAHKKNQCQKEFKQSDSLKMKLVRIQTSEQSLLNELEFFESEKLRSEECLNSVTQSLEANISALDSSVKDIGFMKGETGVLIEKMSMLEKEIPEKNIDMENLDGIVSGTIRALESLYERMRLIETNVKKNYYTNKKNYRGSYDTY